MGYEIPIVSSLQDICINFMKNSKNSQEYALSVTCSEEAEKILFDTEKNPKLSPVICIQTRRTMKDGLYQRGISCGYDVGKRLFLLGTFEGCTCYGAMELTEWSGAIHLKDVVLVIANHRFEYTKWKGSYRNLYEPEDMPYQQTRYLYQSIARWLKKNNDLFGLELSRELLEIANERLIEVPIVKIGYI